MLVKCRCIFFIFVLLVILQFNLSSKIYAQTLTEKILKLMPPDTEILMQKEDNQQFINMKEYKFGTLSEREKIVEFYRLMFTNEGFREIESYSVDRRPSGPKRVYFFTKQNTLIVLNILRLPENGLNIYYITFTTPNIEGIKNFNIKEE